MGGSGVLPQYITHLINYINDLFADYLHSLGDVQRALVISEPFKQQI